MRIVWSRIVVAVFWLFTAGYCLLSAVPFASEQFLRPRLVPALATFADWHPWISLTALLATTAGLEPWLRARHRSVFLFVAGWALIAAVLFVAPPLSQLEPSTTALVLALLSLVPPTWLPMMDLRRAATVALPRPGDGTDDVRRDFAACAMAALVVTAIHAVAAIPYALPFGAGSAGLSVLDSLLTHLVVFSGVFAILCVIRGASRLISTRHAVEGWVARGVMALVLALFIFTIVLRPLSMVGLPAVLVAAAFGVSLAATFGPRATGAAPGVAQALSGLAPRWATRSWPAGVAWLAVVAVGIWSVEQRAASTDWNFTIAKSAAFTSWLLVLAATLRLLPALARGPAWLPFVLCLAVLGLDVAASRPTVSAASAIDAWKGRDPSLRLISDSLAPAASVSDEGLADFLQVHTNIPRRTSVQPVTIDLATLDGAPGATRPHIFVFVIDSLRRDYLSPYNDRVTFTPAIERFARESIVFERAFTHYGATGLSVPSLWVGGLVLHKQYVTPFAPMNTLGKLVEHERYEQWISMDNILDVILPPSERRTPLDARTQVADFRMCATLAEIRGRLGQVETENPPVFAYSLPQDIHVSVITREGAAPVDNESYGSFYAPYASRIRRFDRCFGEFIDDLKARGLFDRSIIVVTSDHGDSLGEQGRMGHAYTIFPEIMQVPLLVHLPPGMAEEHHADTSAPAFTTDLTPTLYALLGHEPARPAPFFGRPLFRKKTDSPPPRSMQPELLASSYGSVYGALSDDARRLYILDAIALHEYAYELDGSAAGRQVSVTDEDRARGQQAIRTTVEAIAQFYGYQP
jgi:hypothetical protein